MLAKRIIPSVLVRGKTAYKGPGFGAQCTRSVGSALAVCRTHARRGVDELLILDIGATPEGRGPDLELVKQLSDECFIPITVGGGVKTLGDIAALLGAGADKVAIGTNAWQEGSDLIQRASDRFGAQAVVAVVEHSNNLLYRSGRPYFLYGLSHPVHMAKRLQAAGAGEIVLMSVDQEASLSGYQISIVAQCELFGMTVPIIVGGGCSGPADMLAAIRAGADGVAAGALFQFTDTTPRDCARYLKANGIEVRL